MKLSVYNHEGNKTKRSVELDDAVFGIEPNDHAIWLDVRAIQAHGRQGTHKTKERGEVARSRRKLYRQKGTGHARAGDAKSPLRRGGGTIFGPKPHEYRLGVNKKTRQLARRSAVVHKVQGEAIRVVEDFSFDAPKTSTVASALGALELSNQKVLILTGAYDEMLHKSARNISKVSACPASEASTLDLANADVLLILESAVEPFAQALTPSAKDASPKADAEEVAEAA